MTMHTTQRSTALTSLKKSPGNTRIGFIGMGLMGIPMSLRLSAADFDVKVWNRNTKKLLQNALDKVPKASSLQALVDHADVIMICVSNTEAVESLVFEKGGIADYLRGDQVIVDFSSIAPDSTRSFAQRLLKDSNTHWVDAPVSGGVAGAETGTLAIMAGGDARIVEALTPLLAPLAQRITRMGDVGSGQATKICNQMLVSCNIVVMAEVLAMAEKAGVDSSLIPSALQGGFADSIPLQISGSRMANRELDEIKWTVKTLIKDLTMATQLSQDNAADTPMSQLAKSILENHGADGFLDLDPATLIEHYLSP